MTRELYNPKDKAEVRDLLLKEQDYKCAKQSLNLADLGTVRGESVPAMKPNDKQITSVTVTEHTATNPDIKETIKRQDIV